MTMTIGKLDELPPTLSLLQGCELFKISESKGRRLAREGRFPCQVIKIDRTWKVLTWSAIEVLKGNAA